jgi:hypothetical protein
MAADLVARPVALTNSRAPGASSEIVLISEYPNRTSLFRLRRRSNAGRYALCAVKQRLHQASFREAVTRLYSGRCAVSHLPEPLLLDVAHIVADKDKLLGQPIIQQPAALEDSSRRLQICSQCHYATISLPNISAYLAPPRPRGIG